MFDSALLKVERAKGHIADLQSTFETFVQAHRNPLRINRDPETGAMSAEVHFGDPIPSSLALILGDAVHNLRTALDHATWELFGLYSGAQDKTTQFPVSKERQAYEATCNKMEKIRCKFLFIPH